MLHNKPQEIKAVFICLF